MSKSLLKRRKQMRNKMNNLGPILQGSVTTVAVRCGNPNCRCTRGQRHRSICLSYSRQGKTQMFYLGHKLAPKAQEWVDNYRQLRRIVQELSDINIAVLKKEREKTGRAARRRKIVRKKG